jgi:Flp pilus assembly protein TadB
MPKSSSGRTVTMVIGVCFVLLVCVILVVAWASTPIGASAGALVVGVLGADAIVSARRDRPSLLSRMGPLP